MNYIDLTNEANGGGGSSNYNDLSNKPQINSVTLSGNKTLTALSIADINASNFTSTGKSAIGKLSLATGTFQDETIGASGTDYEMPFNGYFNVVLSPTASGQYVQIFNNTNTIELVETNSDFSMPIAIGLYAEKGNIITVRYTTSNNGRIRIFKQYGEL